MTVDSSPATPSPAADGDLASELLSAHRGLLDCVGEKTHLSGLLQQFCVTLDKAIAPVRSCVMLYQPTERTLNVGAAPGLPAEFRRALDGLTAGLAPGSCSAAAHRNDLVVSRDLAIDPLWEGLRDAAVEAGFKASWSLPIRSLQLASSPGEDDEVRVVGTVALYLPDQRSPTAQEIKLLDITGALAGLAINAARTQEKVGEHQLYDALTGLPSRSLFFDQLKEALAGLSPHENKMALLRLDLDHFKEVNETFGYAVGDFLLQSVAKRLVARRRGTDLVARFGDDEFIYLIRELPRDDDVRQLAEEILGELSQPHDFGGEKLAVSASLGASVYPWDGEDAQTLLRNAENALHAAKRLGRNRIRLYAPTLGGSGFEKLQLKLALGYAVENHELELLYQPKLRSDTGEIAGIEALTYWNHPTLGRLSPSRFIPLAEESGLILPIGEWVLQSACAQVHGWRRQGFRHLTVAVNISALQFRELGFKDTVSTILATTKLEPEALELEITETVAMTDVDKTMERLDALQKLGLRISIDDFGTGYSSLAYLQRFPIHTLKLDRSFIIGLPENRENRAIVKAVIAMARYMGLELVAEGVEGEGEAEILREEGCELLQGFHFSRPASAAKMEELLHRGYRRESQRSFFIASLLESD
jgi:diguanylate cyclase (GGDEF)-like protein